jgi:hypothetical protein
MMSIPQVYKTSQPGCQAGDAASCQTPAVTEGLGKPADSGPPIVVEPKRAIDQKDITRLCIWGELLH